MADKALIQEIQIQFGSLGGSLAGMEKMINASFKNVGRTISKFNKEMLAETGKMMQEAAASTRLMVDAIDKLQTKQGKKRKTDP